MTTALLTPIDDSASIEAATRRQFLTGLAAAGLLTACGGTEPAGTDVPPATTPFAHALGATEVPMASQRIVSTFGTWQLATIGVCAIATPSAAT